ncbi:MAG: HD domain-containing protein [Nanoarchaeota archaeon]
MIKENVRFLFEMLSLKNLKRTGWNFLGITNKDSVSEHSFNTIMIGYILAKKENANENKVIKMCMIHDIAESRINDLNKVNQRYINHKEIEEKAFLEQINKLDKNIKEEFSNLYYELKNQKTKEAIIVKDADYLECAIQAKEFYNKGNKDAIEWLENAETKLKTKIAKKIIKEIKKSNNKWWDNLKKLD